MSGGNYDYIHYNDVVDFVGYAASLMPLGEMAADFKDLGYPELQVDTIKAIAEIAQLRQECEALDASLRDLRECWKALDLFKSGDVARGTFDSQIERYIRVTHGESDA